MKNTSQLLSLRLPVLLLLATLFLSILAPSQALASSSQNLPWEAPLQKLASSLTGPVAQSICLIAIVICGCALIFGGEIGDFTKRMIYIVMVVAFILGATGFITTMFSSSSAVV